MTERERLLTHLIARVPVHVVDVKAARAAGDLAALRYDKAMLAWLEEAAGLMAEQVTDLFTRPEVGRVESRAMGELEPDGEPPAELVSLAIFPPRAG